MKQQKPRNTVTITISANAELKDKIDARAAQLGRDRTSYLVWLAMKDLGLIPDESYNPKTISTILEVLEQRQQNQFTAGGGLLLSEDPAIPLKKQKSA